MPAVDRNVLRIGVFELLYVDDVPDAVAVSEAMALVRDLSTDESPALRQRGAGPARRGQADPGLSPGLTRRPEAGLRGPPVVAIVAPRV